uniref:Uncharacterized protein n=1 Tax=Plectus sambesii TaxID=2011161 RepID=A0A914V1B9_9BILA
MTLVVNVSLFILAISVGSLLPVFADEWPKSVNDVGYNYLYCPAPVIGERCPDDTVFYHYTCCGDLNKDCCFVLQIWLVVLLVVIAITVIVGFFFAVLRCLFCGR